MTEPTQGPVAQAAAIYLRYEGVGIDELYSARVSVEVDIVERAVARIDEGGRQRLRAAVAAETAGAANDVIPHASELHLVLADVAGNRPLALFLDTLISLSDEYSRPKLARADHQLRIRDSHRAHMAIAEAVIAGDVAAATRRMRSHLVAVKDWMPPS